jgi:hypothetical protein
MEYLPQGFSFGKQPGVVTNFILSYWIFFIIIPFGINHLLYKHKRKELWFQ